MQRGQVDLVIVGTDRTTATGDVVNKIGTYLKALAARDCGVPFYVAAPSSSIDWTIADGREVEIEERAATEVVRLSGRGEAGAIATVRLAPEGTPVANPGFDLTPARLVTGIITERGLAPATREGSGGALPVAGGGEVARVSLTKRRRQILETVRWLAERRLYTGTSGNVSCRAPDGFLVTPTGIACDDLRAADMVEVALDGRTRGDLFRPASGACTATSTGIGPVWAPSSTPTRPSPPRSPACAVRSPPFITWSPRPAAASSAARNTPLMAPKLCRRTRWPR